MMPVYNIVLRAEILIPVAVHKDCSGAVFCPLKRGVQVIIVILPKDDRVIDIGSLGIDPADGIRIDLPEFLKINDSFFPFCF